MSYLGVITLDEAKEYLRVSHNDSDNEITRMIQSALEVVEIKTNVLVYRRSEKKYLLVEGCARVYDGPINTDGVTGLADTVTRQDYHNYSVFTDSDSDNATITLDVGYDNSSCPPRHLIDAALEMIDFWYYKNDGRANITLMPDSVQQTLSVSTRFLI